MFPEVGWSEIVTFFIKQKICVTTFLQYDFHRKSQSISCCMWVSFARLDFLPNLGLQKYINERNALLESVQLIALKTSVVKLFTPKLKNDP